MSTECDEGGLGYTGCPVVRPVMGAPEDPERTSLLCAPAAYQHGGAEEADLDTWYATILGMLNR